MPIRPPAVFSPAPDVLRPKGATSAWRSDSSDCHPARPAAHHPLRGHSCVELRAVDGDPERVGELRAGKPHGGVGVWGDFLDFHGAANLFANRRKRKLRSVA